jgi:hypothetical protein
MNDFIPVTNQKEIEKIFLSDALTQRIEVIKIDALNYVADISTAQGRKSCASKAFEIAKQKTVIDEAGKELKYQYKAACDKIDGVRKYARDTLDEIKDKVREPLTMWEKAEEERIEKEHQEVEYQMAWEEAIRENSLFNRQKEIERREAEIEKKRIEQEAKERAEAAEKARIEREADIARQAKERAEKDAQQAIEKARLDKEKAEREKIESELRAKFAAEKAEKDKKEALERAERDKKEAIEKAKREEIERQTKERLEKERKEAEEKRIAAQKAANLEHQRKINCEAKKCFVNNEINEEMAIKIITLIAKNKINHITINY